MMIKKLLILTLFITIVSNCAFAQLETYNSNKVGVALNATTSVFDPKLNQPEWNLIIPGSMQVNNIVKVGLKENFYRAVNFDISITLEIYLSNSSTDPFNNPDNYYTTKVFNLNYRNEKGYPVKNADSYKIDVPAHAVGVKVVGISSPQFGSNLPFDAFDLFATMTVDRLYQFNPYAEIPLNFSSTGDSDVQGLMSWGSVLGAQEYDLEWTVVDEGGDYSNELNDYLNSQIPIADLEKFFFNNSTRVTLTNQLDYKLNLIYRSKYLLIRIRPVQYVDDVRQYGVWSYINGNGILNIIRLDENNQTFNQFKPNLNWNYDISYAEEGKRKEVINYFDGTLRNRQTVTYNNADQIPIVKENIYDEFGRPLLDVLPAPIKETGDLSDPLKFYTNINKYQSSNYTFSNINEVSGRLVPQPLSTSYGASNYYSPSSNFKSTLDPKSLVIPNAEGFPFSLTQYTKDGTNRIKYQGGVGSTFQPTGTSQDKLTQYFYGKPEQWELDQLFGNDVGYANHYFKNVVIDPNGQASVSYTNLSGKTIATALAGESPTNQNELPNKTTKKVIESELINYDDFIFDPSNLILKASVPFNATSLSNGNKLTINIPKLVYTFNNTSAGNPFDLCSNCFYNLKVIVKDELDGDVIATNVISDYQIGSSTSNCEDVNVFNQDLALKDFIPGTYYISVELALNKQIIENFTTNYINQLIVNNNLKTKSNYILDEINTPANNALLLDDVNDCKVCDQLNTPSFKDEIKAKLINLSDSLILETDPKLNSWLVALEAALVAKCNDLRQNCNLPSTISSPCDEFKNIMLTDVSPGGQYALFNEDYSVLEPEMNVIFKHFRLAFPVLDATNPLYISSKVTLENGNVSSPHDASFTLTDLVKYWRADWAQNFLTFHPEYCKLEFCLTNSSVYGFEKEVKENHSRRDQINSIPGLTSGYNYNTPEWLIEADQAFDPGNILNDKRTEFINRLQTYSEFVAAQNGLPLNQRSNKNITQFIDYLLYCSPNNTTNDVNVWNNCNIAVSDNNCRMPNKEWQYYRDIYFTLREGYIKELRDQYCASNGTYSFTCPIGQPVNLPVTPPANSVSDFEIGEDFNPAFAMPNYKRIYIRRIAGDFNQAVKAIMYYPENYTGVLPSYNFLPNELVKYFYLPIQFNSLSISVKDISYQFYPETTSNIYSLGEAGDNNSFLVYETYQNAILKVFPAGTVQNIIDCNGVSITPTFVNVKNLGIYDAYSQDVLIKQYTEPVDIFRCYINSYVAAPQSVIPSFDNYYPINVEVTQDPWAPYYDPNDPFQQYYSYINVSYANNPDFTNKYVSGWVVLNYSYRSDPNNYNYYYDTSITPLNSFTGSSNFGYPVYGIDVNINYQQYFNSYEIQYNNPNQNPLDPTCPAGLFAKKSRFDYVGEVETSTNTALLTSQANAQIAELGAVNCEDNANDYVRNYYPRYPEITGQDKIEGDLMRAQFLAICQAGVSSAQPNGTNSTINPSVNPNTFGQVIKNIKGLSFYTNQFNPYLISQLYPQNAEMHVSSFVATELAQPIIDKLQTYRSNNGTIQNTYLYLKNTFGSEMTLSLEELKELYRAVDCSSSNELDFSIALPSFFKPNGTRSRAEYLNAKTELSSEFNNNLDVNSPEYETIFANFMNQKFGFGMAYYQYNKFETDLNATLLFNYAPQPFVDYLAAINTKLITLYQEYETAYDADILNKKANFRLNYINTCSEVKPSVNITTQQSFYHFTLYYYDQAGNLLRTVPPQGVKTLTLAQTAQTALFRQTGIQANDCNISGFSTDKIASFNSLQQTLATSSASAIEMWLYKDDPTSSHVIFTAGSSGSKYIVNTCLLNQNLAVEIYSITEQSGAATITLSNKVFLNLQGIQLFPWNHIVIQGNQLSSSAFNVYVNGKKANIATNPITPNCSWQIAGNGSSIAYPEDLAQLKHLRVYNRLMSFQEISANAENFCFQPSQNALAWLRWNIPTQSGPSTLAGSTNEGRSKAIYPTHGLTTNYAYNSLNQVSKQSTPDAGESSFYYDHLGRLFASRNAKQDLEGTYSYTKYDLEGRIIEVGRKETTTAASLASSFNFNNSSFLLSGSNNQITRTIYDDKLNLNNFLPALPVTAPTSAIENTRKRVVASLYTEDNAAFNNTFYSYDLAGNVKTLWQQLSGLGEKRIDYNYDLISGKVNMVAYQYGAVDQFFYQYKYDAENRLTSAWSAIDGVFKSNGGNGYLLDGRMDASYKYYLHGPLARMELSYPIVQGIDYAYTLQGWLKGVNSTNLGEATDIGKDGNNVAGNINKDIPKDVFGYALHYYGSNDYKTIGGTSVKPFAEGAAAGFGFTPLYNGNIAGMSVNNPTFGLPYLYTYKYDQLNRLNKTFTYKGLNATTNSWNTSASQSFRETFTYDANGNILTLKRNGNLEVGDQQEIDNLKYNYFRDVNGDLINNKLRNVEETAAESDYPLDLENQTNSDNYQYDAIGNLTRDLSENITNIKWSVYGKIQEIFKSYAGGSYNRLSYRYDATGNRVSKDNLYFNGSGGISTSDTWYVRDAQGNTLATYSRGNGSTISYDEQNLYGSSRLGIWKPNAIDTEGKRFAWNSAYYRNFEISNHLGNVTAVVAGDYFTNSLGVREAYVSSAKDYYAFGSLKNDGNFQAPTYRYGFNGKENDNEVKGEGNSIDFGARIYDPRLGKFLSIDPLTSDYPELSPFLYGANNPIYFIDFNGEGPKSAKDLTLSTRVTRITGSNFLQVILRSRNYSMEALERWGWSNNKNVQRNGERVVKGLVGESIILSMLTSGKFNAYERKIGIDVWSPKSISRVISNVSNLSGEKVYDRDVDILQEVENMEKVGITLSRSDGSEYKMNYVQKGKQINFVFEVKTVDEEGYYTASSIIKGFDQAVMNSNAVRKSRNSKTIPILVTDKNAFQNAMKAAGFSNAYNKFKANGGKLILINGLEEEASNKTNEIKNEVQRGEKL